MRRLLTASAVLLSPLFFAACATNLTPRPSEGPQGTVVGVIHLPEGVSPNNACEHLQVYATNAQGQKLGESSVHASRNRCSYTLNYVEANVPVKIAVASTGGECGQGAVATQNLPDQLQLQNSETKLVDFGISCGK